MLGRKTADRINSVSGRNRAANVMRKSNKALRTELSSSTPSVSSLQLQEGGAPSLAHHPRWTHTHVRRIESTGSLPEPNWNQLSCRVELDPSLRNSEGDGGARNRDCPYGCRGVTQWPSFTSLGQMSSSERAGPAPAFCCCGKKQKGSFTLLLSLKPEERNQGWPLLLWTERLSESRTERAD